MKKKTANMEVIAENTLRNSYEKRLKKNIKFDSFLYAFWERGDDELLHVQRRMHPEAPESSRKAERLRIKPGDSKLLHVQRRMHPEAPESSRKAERLRIKPGDSNIKVMY
ncbi:hypothetical protein [Escherichia coli]|uniref:hypothetical protein n=1 Tax=Escherichia coli TaxID=562 RepID=UPI0028832E2D|nr:hypothetical protein [Escherichia coli]